MSETIGFIGLGIMGKPMARNLLKAGHLLVVHNRGRAPVDELVAEGARGVFSPAEVAEASDVVITMLPDTPDVRSVVLGQGGVLDGARSGSVLIDMSTIAPAVTRQIAAEAAKFGMKTLDAPVSGSEQGAINATLAIMVGGDADVFQRCRPILSRLGKSVVHVGGVGMGHTVKLVNQIIGLTTLEAVCEGLLVAAKAGVDLSVLLEAISGGAARSWMLENLAPKIAERDFRPGFMVQLAQKDLRLALNLADELHVSTPGTGLTHQLYRSIEASAEGREGIQALAKALERLAGFEVGASSLGRPGDAPRTS
ncbi:MAG TPA: NAD(P)-binding domain-containing protein [Chloroflexota bacterium]|nr:NAD(P)-binding domain-containing protein [Chloroflexota bacterium]